jgi:hypothetical protein
MRRRLRAVAAGPSQSKGERRGIHSPARLLLPWKRIEERLTFSGDPGAPR